MKATTKTLLGLGALGVIAVGSLSYAGPVREKITERVAGNRIDAALGEHRLSAEQRERIVEILQTNQYAVEPLVRQFLAERREVRDAIQEGPKNRAEIFQQIDETAAVGEELALARAVSVQEILTVLTPEQKERAAEIEQRIMNRVDELLAADWSQLLEGNAVLPEGGPLSEHLALKRQQALEKLALTDGQRQKIQRTLEQEQDGLQPLLEEMVAEHRELRQLIRTSPVDEDAIREQVGEIAEVAKDVAMKKAVIYQTITYDFTQEQMDQLEALEQRVENRVDLVVDFVFDWLAS